MDQRGCLIIVLFMTKSGTTKMGKILAIVPHKAAAEVLKVIGNYGKTQESLRFDAECSRCSMARNFMIHLCVCPAIHLFVCLSIGLSADFGI